MSPPAGQKIVELSPKKAELQKLFEGHPGALEVQPNAWILPRAFEKYAKDIHDLEVRTFHQHSFFYNISTHLFNTHCQITCFL